MNILDICCNLVVLDEELDIFRFAHLSVREYLETRSDYAPNEGHALAVERCLLTYLHKQSEARVAAIANQYTIFQKYSIMYWPAHYQYIDGGKGGTGPRQMLGRFLCQEDRTSSSFSPWTHDAKSTLRSIARSEPLRDKLQAVSSPAVAPIFTACAFALSDILAEPIVVQLIDWDEKNDDGKTGLHLAAQYGYADFIKVLIKNGANVMVGDANANTALHLAVQYDIESVVCSLLGNGAKVDCFDRKGWTPLHRAAEKGLHAITGHLLGATENIMCATTCDSGWTALHIAARYGHEVIVKDIAHIILQQGGNFAMEDNYGYTPFQHAKRGAHHSAANYLLETLKRTQAVPTELPEVSVKVPEDPPDGTSI